MTLRYLGQSGYFLHTERSCIAIDPYLSDSVNRIAGRPRLLPIPVLPSELCLDAVICTHHHLDHLDPDTVEGFPNTMPFMTTASGRDALLRLGKQTVTVLSEGDTVRIGDFKVTAVFAAHTVEAFGLIVAAEGKTLYFSGDTLYHEKLFDIAMYHPDVAFLCINGKLGNMNVEEALTVAEKIGAPINIPNHYDMFASNAEDPHLFADKIRGGRILEWNQSYIF